MDVYVLGVYVLDGCKRNCKTLKQDDKKWAKFHSPNEKLSVDMSVKYGGHYTIKLFETLKIHETIEVDR